MDPDETLARLREEVRDRDDDDPMLELFDALDGWLSRAGVLPAAWANVNTDKAALDAIAAIMSGKQWSPDWLDSIADIVRLAGRTIADIDEADAYRRTMADNDAFGDLPDV